MLQASQEYAGRLVSAHTDSCPWRDTVCDAKLGRFPKLPARDVYVDFEQRYAHLDKLAQLPPLTEQAVDKIKESVRYSAQSTVAASSNSIVHHPGPQYVDSTGKKPISLPGTGMTWQWFSSVRGSGLQACRLSPVCQPKIWTRSHCRHLQASPRGLQVGKPFATCNISCQCAKYLHGCNARHSRTWCVHAKDALCFSVLATLTHTTV